MSKNVTKIETGIHNADKLNKALRGMIYRTAFTPVLFLMIYLLLKVTNIYQWEQGGFFVIGLFTGAIIGLMLRGFKANFIYSYSLNNETLNLFLVSVFGKKKVILISINQIDKIKYRKKGVWRRYDKLWIHLIESVKEYSFIKSELGNELVDKLDIDKI